MIKIINSAEKQGNDFGLIVPFTVIGKENGGFDYEVFDCFEDTLKNEMTETVSDYLSDNFYKRIGFLLSDAVKTMGYEPDYRITHSFTMNYICDKSVITYPGAVKITDLSGFVDLTEMDFDTDEFPVFAVTEGKSIASVCGVNGRTGDKSVEIAVATIEKCYRHGYALSCVSLMTDYLVKRGYTVSYVCDSDNEPSCALAARAGFSLYSRDYNYVCFEKE